MGNAIEWIQIGVIMLLGSESFDAPSTATIYSVNFPTQNECEADLIKMRLGSDSVLRKIKTNGVFVTGNYEQLVVTTPINLKGLGKGYTHYSCVPHE